MIDSEKVLSHSVECELTPLLIILDVQLTSTILEQVMKVLQQGCLGIENIG